MPPIHKGTEAIRGATLIDKKQSTFVPCNGGYRLKPTLHLHFSKQL